MQVPPTSSTQARPRVALVIHDLDGYGGMERAIAELIKRAADRFEFVVLSATLARELRPLVEWRRIHVPSRRMPLKFAFFFVVAALQLRHARVQLVCTVGAIVPNRTDVVSVHFSHAGFCRATGRLAPEGAAFSRRLN